MNSSIADSRFGGLGCKNGNILSGKKNADTFLLLFIFFRGGSISDSGSVVDAHTQALLALRQEWVKLGMRYKKVISSVGSASEDTC